MTSTRLRSIRSFAGSLALVAGLFTFPATIGAQPEGLTRHMVGAAALPNVPGHNLTAVSVELAPGTTVPAHKHAGFVFVYVLEGTVRSQLDDAEPVDFKTGESWMETPGVTHTLTQNPSDTEIARVLAVFVAETDAKLTTFPATR